MKPMLVRKLEAANMRKTGSRRREASSIWRRAREDSEDREKNRKCSLEEGKRKKSLEIRKSPPGEDGEKNHFYR